MATCIIAYNVLVRSGDLNDSTVNSITSDIAIIKDTVYIGALSQRRLI